MNAAFHRYQRTLDRRENLAVRRLRILCVLFGALTAALLACFCL